MRILLNTLALAVELVLIAGAAWLGANHPIYFAALTALLAFVAGAWLEYARFAHEVPFYFGRRLSGVMTIVARVWTMGEAALKAAVAGLVALLTFSGTDHDRLVWIALLFAVCVVFGTTMLLRVSLNWGGRAIRWGYFRLALPLGILFSAGIYALTTAGAIRTSNFGDVAFDATFNLASRPSIETAGEFLFKLSQATDGLIAALLSAFVAQDYIPAIQIVASTNVLPGFVVAVFTVAIARLAFAITGRGGVLKTPDQR